MVVGGEVLNRFELGQEGAFGRIEDALCSGQLGVREQPAASVFGANVQEVDGVDFAAVELEAHRLGLDDDAIAQGYRKLAETLVDDVAQSLQPRLSVESGTCPPAYLLTCRTRPAVANRRHQKAQPDKCCDRAGIERSR